MLAVIGKPPDPIQPINQIGSIQAEQLFDMIEKFAGYGFNKSHSTAYGAIAYQTAYLKAHYPAQFMAALLSSQIDSTDAVVGYIAETRSLGIEVLPPDVNEAQKFFTVVSRATEEPEASGNGQAPEPALAEEGDDGGQIVLVFNNLLGAYSTKLAHGEIAPNWEFDGLRIAERWWFA